MTNPIGNETSLVLVVALIFSAIAIPVLSGFLEPSQPPPVAAIQIGDPRDDDADGPAGQVESTEGEPAGDSKPERSARSRSRERRAQPAPSAPADDAAEDDRGEAD